MSRCVGDRGDKLEGDSGAGPYEKGCSVTGVRAGDGRMMGMPLIGLDVSTGGARGELPGPDGLPGPGPP